MIQNNSSSLPVFHRHNFNNDNNHLVCSICGKKKLKLNHTNIENISMGTRNNGIMYTVRNDRHRYFFPKEWNSFIKTIKNDKHYIFFLTLLHTGARVMETLHLKPINFNITRSTITLNVVKQRKAKKQFYAIGKTRTYFVSEKYIKEVKKYIETNNISDNNYLFLNNLILPEDYDKLSNTDKKKHYISTENSYFQLFKRKLKSAGINDWRNFSLHNIRKTYGNWMRIYEIKTEEICYRLGHDFNTYLIHYGSPLIFTSQEKLEIMNIFGQVK